MLQDEQAGQAKFGQTSLPPELQVLAKQKETSSFANRYTALAGELPVLGAEAYAGGSLVKPFVSSTSLNIHLSILALVQYTATK